MTALKQAIAEVSFFLPAGRNHRKGEGMRKEQFGSLACGISHCWQSSDWNVMGRKLLIIETIQEPLFLHKFENKQVIYFLPDDSFEKLMGFVKAFRWDLADRKHCSVRLLPRAGPDEGPYSLVHGKPLGCPKTAQAPLCFSACWCL